MALSGRRADGPKWPKMTHRDISARLIAVLHNAAARSGPLSLGQVETFPEDETFDVGEDTRTGVALVEYRYDVPFKFTGKIDKLTFKLEPEQRADTKH